MLVKKTIGKKTEEIYPDMVHNKFFAFHEMITPLMENMNATGTYQTRVMARLICGLKEISNDLLTEMDQVFLKGEMETPDEEPENKAKELEEEVLAAMKALRVLYPYEGSGATERYLTHTTDTYEAVAKLFFLAKKKAGHPLPECVKKRYIVTNEAPDEMAAEKPREEHVYGRIKDIHFLVNLDLESPDSPGVDNLSHWMAEIDLEIEKLQELKKRCIEERARRKKDYQAKATEEERALQ
ncbi:MAG: hypothetical protein QY316_06340 [Thermodesulfobacteriota bacterium]|nr:MAG: hypothetical protein QY316_06340 [Thermodesulfobacteriota bacterium]